MLELTVICGFVGFLVAGSMLKGYVFSILWAWFVVPTFGLPPLAIAPAIGVALLVSFLTYQSDATKTPEGGALDRFTETASLAFVVPVLVLGVGWVVRQFM